MTAIRPLAIAVISVLCTASQSLAQGGTVSSPTTSNVTQTTFDVKGTYTVAPGWTVTSVYISCVPTGGGPSFSKFLGFQNGQIGLVTQQGVVPQTVGNLAYGTQYDIRLTVQYRDNANPRITGQVSGALATVTTKGP